MFHKLKNPILFQGNLKKKNYFEGWYYKMVSRDLNYSLAVIPGVSVNRDNPHAFIQFFITNKTGDLKTRYLTYDIKDFLTEDNPFNLSIGNNRFSEDSIDLLIDNQEINLNGNLLFLNQIKIKTTVFSPSIMGFFSYFKFMECYHGVISMNHSIEGKLNIDGEIIDFTGGLGYIEKDWRKSFPKEYVWMQCNHFKTVGTSFMFSEALIPLFGLCFNGLIVNLVVNNQEYRFATYNSSRVRVKDIKSNEVYYEIKKGKLKLIVRAINGKTTSLQSQKKVRW